MRLQRLCFLILPLLTLPAFADSFTLGSAVSFGLLGGTVSNTGTSIVTGDVGVPSEKGKNRTLGRREWPERSVFSGRYAGVAAPEVIAGQVDVFPAQRR